MRTVTVAPALVLTDEMYELAKAGLTTCAPEVAAGFTWEGFVTRENWCLIPDAQHPEKPWYKAELALKQGPPYEQTIKLNVWSDADLRAHSHPWESFTATVLLGGYEENRYDVAHASLLANDPYSAHDLGPVTAQRGVIYQAGGRNYLPQTTFHEVTRILDPGRTLSMMDCGPSRKDGWGYLDPRTRLYTPKRLSPIDPRFQRLLLDRNPHLR